MAPVTTAQKIAAGFFVLLVISTWVYMSIALEGTPMGKKFHVLFEQPVKGLAPSSVVYYNGIPIGKVTKIVNEFDSNRVRVDILITKKDVEVFGDLKTTEKILPGTRACLVRSWVTGIQYIDLTGGLTGNPTLAEGSEIPSRSEGMAKWSKNADRILESVEVILKNVEHVTAPEKLNRIDKIFANIEQMSVDANNRLLGKDPASLMSRLEKVLDNLDRLTGKENIEYLRKILDNVDHITDPKAAGWTQWLLDIQHQSTDLLASVQALSEDLRMLIDSHGKNDDMVAIVRKLNGILEKNHGNLREAITNIQRLTELANQKLKALSGDARKVMRNLNYLLNKELPTTNRNLQRTLRELSSLLRILKAKPNALFWGSDVKGKQ